jgi:transposase
MRGTDKRSGELFSYVDLEQRVRADHPLRAIREVVSTALAALSGDFPGLYSGVGRTSIPPEMLLRAILLQAFYSIRSERQLMERLEFDLLFRWFVGLGVDEPVWDHSSFSKNRDRLLAGDIAAKFLAAVLAQPRVKRLLSSEHFSVDGTLIEAWASMQSFKPRQAPGGDDGGDDRRDGGRNAAAGFKGEKRSNATHASTTDPDAMLYRKGPGMEARLCFIGHGLMENRSGLIVGTRLTRVSGHAERLAALGLIAPRGDRSRAVTLGGRQGLRRQGLRDGAARAQRAPAGRPEHQSQALGDRPEHHPASRLCHEPAHPQADRGGVRLDQDGGRSEEDPVPRAGARRPCLHLRGRRLQSGADTQAVGRSPTVTAPMDCRLVGRWRIVEADLWDRDYLDLVEPATMTIGADGHGEIAYGAMQASLDLEYSRSMVFFTWAGFDEMDDVSGSGAAELNDDGTIEIAFAYHLGDEAVLKAERMTSSTAC